MNFGDLMEFEVDVTGQGKLNLKWNTDFDPEFAAMYDYANIDSSPSNSSFLQQDWSGLDLR